MTAVSSLPSIGPSESLGLESLTQTLDHLLERYLGVLHQHQILQQELSQHLSSVRVKLSILRSFEKIIVVLLALGFPLPRAS